MTGLDLLFLTLLGPVIFGFLGSVMAELPKNRRGDLGWHANVLMVINVLILILWLYVFISAISSLPFV